MIINPFTPAVMATEPDAFYGRDDELRILSRAIHQGSVAIQGSVGIGKSSLLSRLLYHMDGFMSDENSICLIVVGNRDVLTVDDAARLLLEELVDVDESHESIRIGIPKLAQYESKAVYQHFKQGRHLAALTKIIEDKAFTELISKKRHLIFAVDEADKCARPLARLIRLISTKMQLHGVNNIRFLLAGVNPYYAEMIDEDEGVTRFIYKTINLGPLLPGEAQQLLEEKFSVVQASAMAEGSSLAIDKKMIERIKSLSGGHPHLLQLLGSHVVEHEILDPDGVIDSRDLTDSLRSICYESRGPVYDSILHRIRSEGKADTFATLVELAGPNFPGLIRRNDALEARSLAPSDLQWLLEANIIVLEDENNYRIVDEFLRIRIILDTESQTVNEIEGSLVEDGSFVTLEQIDFEKGDAQ